MITKYYVACVPNSTIIFKTSFKCSQMISRIYRVLLGEEDLPTSERSVFYNNKTYTDKVYNKSIDDMIKDKDR